MALGCAAVMAVLTAAVLYACRAQRPGLMKPCGLEGSGWLSTG
jgi:hypothetical protein